MPPGRTTTFQGWGRLAAGWVPRRDFRDRPGPSGPRQQQASPEGARHRDPHRRGRRAGRGARSRGPIAYTRDAARQQPRGKAQGPERRPPRAERRRERSGQGLGARKWRAVIALPLAPTTGRGRGVAGHALDELPQALIRGLVHAVAGSPEPLRCLFVHVGAERCKVLPVPPGLRASGVLCGRVRRSRSTKPGDTPILEAFCIEFAIRDVSQSCNHLP